jgi:Protein of unknown function (DUF2851)
MFKESFLHFIWQYQYFNTIDLQCSSGNELLIINVGAHNHHEGPDFKNAHIKFNGLDWFGSIEIHRKASDWYSHQHEKDENYGNVILHVVWEYDQDVIRKDQSIIPTLELKGKIKPGIIKRYKEIITSKATIPCEKVFRNVRPITKLSMLEKVLVQRLQSKSGALLEILKSKERDWEETAYQWLGMGFGFKTNAQAFQELTKKVPLKLIHKHASSKEQIEALLFGQAGFLLEDCKAPYSSALYKEYGFLKSKYKLESSMYRAQWTFGSVRPANYPLRRISQFASLLTLVPNIFSFFTQGHNIENIDAFVNVEASDYWTNHIDFEKSSMVRKGALSKTAIENLIINVTVPFLVALWQDRGEEHYLQVAQELLMQLGPERNKILSSWNALGWNVSNAYDSQGLIQLYNNYCKDKRCLDCSIGLELIRTVHN